MRIVLKSRGPFAFAGLWEAQHRPEGAGRETFTIVTTGPIDLLLPIHDRRPVILRREHEGG